MSLYVLIYRLVGIWWNNVSSCVGTMKTNMYSSPVARGILFLLLFSFCAGALLSAQAGLEFAGCRCLGGQ